MTAPIPKASELLSSWKERKDETGETDKISFKLIAKDIIQRQRDDKDTIIYISGDRRNGKTTWGLKLLRAFIEEKKRLDPDYSWNWQDNFADNTEDATKKYRVIQQGSFIFIDEGDEVLSTGDANTSYQKRLIKVMNKVGERNLLCIINHPNFFGLKKEVRNMATLAVMIPYRYKKVCAFAFIYGRNQNPINDDKFAMELKKKSYKRSKVSKKLFNSELDGNIKVWYQGEDRDELVDFGAEIIDERFIRIPYPKTMFNDLANMPTFLFMMRYTKVNQRFYDEYKIKVKKRIVEQDTSLSRKVSRAEYDKMYLRLRTLLTNLFIIDEKKPRVLERYLIDHEGRRLLSAPTIQRMIEEEVARIRGNRL